MPLSFSFKKCSVALLLSLAVPIKENSALFSHGLPVWLVLADHLDFCKNPQSSFYLPAEGVSMKVLYHNLDKVKHTRLEYLEARENRHAFMPGSLHIFAFKPLLFW